MESPTQDSIEFELNINIKEYFALFKQSAWVIILVTIVAGMAAFFISRSLTPVYQATTTVLVNEAPANAALDNSSLSVSERLTSTYSEMMSKTPVMIETSRRLGLTLPIDELQEMITVKPIMYTQLIEVLVESVDPAAAALIANTVVEVFAAQVQEVQSERFAQSKSSLASKLAEVETELDLFTALAASSNTTDAERAEYSAKATQYREIYFSLQQSIEQVWLAEAQTISSVAIVEPASVPDKPIRPQVMLTTALAALVAFILAAGMVVAREALDDTIRTPEDIKRYLGLPVLGMIDTFSKDKEDRLITANKPRSPVTEGFRSLRENIKFASIDRPLRTLLVTSSIPAEGKSTIAANLAVVFAQADVDTILIDCDLRRPKVHTFFNISNNYGLSNMFFKQDEQLDESSFQTPNKKLRVVPSGKLPPNPAELLSSERMKKMLARLQNLSDLIILDSPPIQVVTDAVSLAPLVDGVVLVLQPGMSHISSARQTLEQLGRAKAQVLGVVINHKDLNQSRYAYLYGNNNGRDHYRHYYHDGTEVLEPKSSPSDTA